MCERVSCNASCLGKFLPAADVNRTLIASLRICDFHRASNSERFTLECFLDHEYVCAVNIRYNIGIEVSRVDEEHLSADKYLYDSKIII